MLAIRYIENTLYPEPKVFKIERLKNDYSFTTESIADRHLQVDNEFDNGSLKTEENDEWLTTAEAAEYMKLSVGSFLNMVSDGHIPHYKLGRRNRYLRCELRNLLSAEARGRMYYDKIR